MIRVFGIGNSLLMDDGVGIEVVKTIKESEWVSTYLSEIYVEEALEEIKEDDYVVIVDAVQMDMEPGELITLSLKECSTRIQPKVFSHDQSLLHTLLLFYPNINGELIGIQIAGIQYNEGLSPELSKKLSKISENVNDHIQQLVKQRSK